MSLPHSLTRFHPVLEKRYEEETRLYLFADADDTAFIRSQSGVYTADLRKVALFAASGGLLLLFLLRHR